MGPYYEYYQYVAIIMVVSMLLLVAFEIVMQLNDLPGDNMNYIIYTWSKSKYFFIPFFWGVIAGHLFMGSTEPIMKNQSLSIVLAGVLALILIVSGLVLKNPKAGPAVQFALLILGFMFGHWVWSMQGLIG